MMNRPKISVIVPVYKVEKYLHKCVDSILMQTYSNLEIILVDDGSPDNCGLICDEYASKYENIQVVHQENQGLSAARNTGISVSTGEYIAFVDSDDSIHASMYEKLFSAMCEMDADLAICGSVDCYENDVTTTNVVYQEPQVITAKEAIELLLRGDSIITSHAWNKLYHRSVFENLKFPVGKIYEDSYVIMDVLEKSNRIALCYEGLYNYYHREGSIVESSFRIKDMDLQDAWHRNYNRIVEKYPDLKPCADYRYLWVCFYLLDKTIVCNVNVPEKRYLIDILRKHVAVIVKNPYFRKNRKIAAMVLMFSSALYGLIVRHSGK